MELQNLQSIFNEKFFRVPDYQRGYSWENQQCEDLWRDIDLLRDGQDHYTGLLFVRQPEKKHEDSVIPLNSLVSVVDGQQRITTLIILINAILNSDIMAEKEWINGKHKDDYQKKYLFVRMGKQGEIIEPVFGYDKDNPSHVYFQENILDLNPIDSGVPSRTLYTRNLELAKKFFADKVNDLSFDEAEVVLRKVTEQLKFNYYQIDDDLNEFVAFETMNNRGKKLSDLELLKNRLIYLSTLLPNNDYEEKKALRDDINEAWKIIYEYLGKGEKPLDDDGFLKDHWIMYFGYGGRQSSKVYKDDLLKNHFTAVAVRDGLKLSDIREYTYDIQRAVKSYFFLHNPEHPECSYSEEVKCWLGKLNRLGYFAFSPLVTSILTKEKVGDSIVVNVLELAERFNFVSLRVHFFQVNYKNSIIYKCANNFHNDEWTLEDVKKQLTLDALQISSEVSKKSFCEKVSEKYWDNFYEWRGLHYFLYEYEIDLQKKAGGEEKVSWKSAINNETIEHIYPQTPDHGWDNLFVLDDDKHPLLHDLGNLLLLSDKMNKKISNGPFVKKSEVFSKNSYSAIEVSRCSEWDPESVEKRKENLLNFLWERWGLQEPKA